MPCDHLVDHDKLNVYSKTLDFITWVTALLERVPKSAAVYNQLDRSSPSKPQNIAEGTGKFTTPDRCRYYGSARGSALGCATALDVLVAKRILQKAKLSSAKKFCGRLSPCWSALIKSIAPDRVFETMPAYGEGSGS